MFVSPIYFIRGMYYVIINNKTHKAGRRRSLRRLAKRQTNITPTIVRSK